MRITWFLIGFIPGLLGGALPAENIEAISEYNPGHFTKFIKSQSVARLNEHLTEGLKMLQGLQEEISRLEEVSDPVNISRIAKDWMKMRYLMRDGNIKLDYNVASEDSRQLKRMFITLYQNTMNSIDAFIRDKLRNVSLGPVERLQFYCLLITKSDQCHYVSNKHYPLMKLPLPAFTDLHRCKKAIYQSMYFLMGNESQELADIIYAASKALTELHSDFYLFAYSMSLLIQDPKYYPIIHSITSATPLSIETFSNLLQVLNFEEANAVMKMNIIFEIISMRRDVDSLLPSLKQLLIERIIQVASFVRRELIEEHLKGLKWKNYTAFQKRKVLRLGNVLLSGNTFGWPVGWIGNTLDDFNRSSEIDEILFVMQMMIKEVNNSQEAFYSKLALKLIPQRDYNHTSGDGDYHIVITEPSETVEVTKIEITENINEPLQFDLNASDILFDEDGNLIKTHEEKKYEKDLNIIEDIDQVEALKTEEVSDAPNDAKETIITPDLVANIEKDYLFDNEVDDILSNFFDDKKEDDQKVESNIVEKDAPLEEECLSDKSQKEEDLEESEEDAASLEDKKKVDHESDKSQKDKDQHESKEEVVSLEEDMKKIVETSLEEKSDSNSDKIEIEDQEESKVASIDKGDLETSLENDESVQSEKEESKEEVAFLEEDKKEVTKEVGTEENVTSEIATEPISVMKSLEETESLNIIEESIDQPNEVVEIIKSRSPSSTEMSSNEADKHQIENIPPFYPNPVSIPNEPSGYEVKEEFINYLIISENPIYVGASNIQETESNDSSIGQVNEQVDTHDPISSIKFGLEDEIKLEEADSIKLESEEELLQDENESAVNSILDDVKKETNISDSDAVQVKDVNGSIDGTEHKEEEPSEQEFIKEVNKVEPIESISEKTDNTETKEEVEEHSTETVLKEVEPTEVSDKENPTEAKENSELVFDETEQIESTGEKTDNESKDDADIDSQTIVDEMDLAGFLDKEGDNEAKDEPDSQIIVNEVDLTGEKSDTESKDEVDFDSKTLLEEIELGNDKQDPLAIFNEIDFDGKDIENEAKEDQHDSENGKESDTEEKEKFETIQDEVNLTEATPKEADSETKEEVEAESQTILDEGNLTESKEADDKQHSHIISNEVGPTDIETEAKEDQCDEQTAKDTDIESKEEVELIESHANLNEVELTELPIKETDTEGDEEVEPDSQDIFNEVDLSKFVDEDKDIELKEEAEHESQTVLNEVELTESTGSESKQEIDSEIIMDEVDLNEVSGKESDTEIKKDNELDSETHITSEKIDTEVEDFEPDSQTVLSGAELTKSTDNESKKGDEVDSQIIVNEIDLSEVSDEESNAGLKEEDETESHTIVDEVELIETKEETEQDSQTILDEVVVIESTVKEVVSEEKEEETDSKIVLNEIELTEVELIVPDTKEEIELIEVIDTENDIEEKEEDDEHESQTIPEEVDPIEIMEIKDEQTILIEMKPVFSSEETDTESIEEEEYESRIVINELNPFESATNVTEANNEVDVHSDDESVDESDSQIDNDNNQDSVAIDQENLSEENDVTCVDTLSTSNSANRDTVQVATINNDSSTASNSAHVNNGSNTSSAAKSSVETTNRNIASQPSNPTANNSVSSGGSGTGGNNNIQGRYPSTKPTTQKTTKQTPTKGSANTRVRSKSEGMGQGLKIGIAVGVGIAIIAVIAVGYYLIF